MQLLVTGGAGFIGSNFVHHIIDSTNHNVTTLDSLTYAGDKQNVADVADDQRHTFVQGDITDRKLITDLVDASDAVVNFAAESHVDRSINGAGPFVTTNVQGTRTLLDAARKTDLEAFVQISTDEVYGQILDGTFSEDDRLTPRNPYAATKAGADLLALSYHTTYDVPVLITRSSNNFGPRQHREKLIPKLITNAFNREPLPLYGDGSNVREWLYVEDNCRAIESVLANGEPGTVYNIGSGVELENLTVAEKIVEMTGASHDLITFVEDRPGHDQRYAVDTSRIESELGWSPEYEFDEALASTIKWYRGD